MLTCGNHAPQFPAFVINLARATDRRATFLEHARRHAWDVEVFSAIDWRDLDYEDCPGGVRIVRHKTLPEIRREILPRPDIDEPFKPGEIAYTLSHMEVWRQVLARNLDAAFVFEDDALIERPWTPLELPDDAEFVCLNDRVHALVPDDFIAPTPDGADPRAAFAPMFPGCGTEAYIVTRAGARSELEIMERIFLPLDVQLFACGHGAIAGNSEISRWRGDLPECRIYVTLQTFTRHADDAFSYIEESVGPRRIRFGSGGVEVPGWRNGNVIGHKVNDAETSVLEARKPKPKQGWKPKPQPKPP